MRERRREERGKEGRERVKMEKGSIMNFVLLEMKDSSLKKIDHFVKMPVNLNSGNFHFEKNFHFPNSVLVG